MYKRILLTQGQFTIVDIWQYNWLTQWGWCAWWNKDTKSYYAVRDIYKKNSKTHRIYMAREILGLKRGDKRQGDHRNHNTLDNREFNLRIVTHQQNSFNRKNVKGYFWNKRHGKYNAQIMINGKNIYLGLFNTTKEAHSVYLKAKKLYHKI